MVSHVELTPRTVSAKIALITPDGKINRKFLSETAAVLRPKGQQHTAMSEGQEGRGRLRKREADSERETWEFGGR